MTLHLHALGHFHPENEITNAFLESLDIGTSDQWILERTGIRSRRTLMPLDYIRQTYNKDPRGALEAQTHSAAEIGERAARMACERAGVPVESIGMVVAGSSAMDYASPAEACNIARRLDLEVPALDMNSACTSFYAQLHMLSLMREDALPDYVLLVAPEGLSRTVDYSDRTAAVLWGDAAIAAVVSLRVPGRARVLGSSLTSSPAGADKVKVPRLGHFQQEGRTVQMFAIRKSSELLAGLRENFGDEDRTFNFVGHQANLRMLESVCRKGGVASEHHHTNVEWYGNTGAASSGSVISMRWEKWRSSDDVAVAGVGSGLTWSGYLLRFADDAEAAAS